MFVGNNFIYIQMQKTGCSHIEFLLSELFDGKVIGKHNAATVEQLGSYEYFISSIRNPWDWYLSLWTYGVQGQGGLRNRLTSRNLRPALKKLFTHPKVGWRWCADELRKDVKVWRSLYDRDQDVVVFRKWLKAIHNPQNNSYLGEGYGESCISDKFGYMTHRYLYLCCKNYLACENNNVFFDYDDIDEFDKSNCYIDYFIRQESLEDSLCEAIRNIRNISDLDIDLIYNSKKTNYSKREKHITEYYDQETVEIVNLRDRLIIDKFGYKYPG